jgi:hypothetical protein
MVKLPLVFATIVAGGFSETTSTGALRISGYLKKKLPINNTTTTNIIIVIP